MVLHYRVVICHSVKGMAGYCEPKVTTYAAALAPLSYLHLASSPRLNLEFFHPSDFA